MEIYKNWTDFQVKNNCVNYVEVKPEVQVTKPDLAKKPWQVTRDEYEKRFSNPDNLDKEKIQFIHRIEVERAIAEGDSVPPEVLAEYPDLVKPVVKTIPKELEPLPIPKELEPLAQWLREEVKAGRIKSAKEFVKSILQERKPYVDHTFNRQNRLVKELRIAVGEDEILVAPIRPLGISARMKASKNWVVKYLPKGEESAVPLFGVTNKAEAIRKLPKVLTDFYNQAMKPLAAKEAEH